MNMVAMPEQPNRLEGDKVSVTVDKFSLWRDEEVAGVCEHGIKAVVVAEPVILSLSDHAAAKRTLGFLCCLKSATARGLKVEWRLQFIKDIDHQVLFHLWPPNANSDCAKITNVWRQSYRFGKCYWRNGGRHIEIIDKRLPNDQMQHIIDEEDMVAIFKLGNTPRSTEVLAKISGDALVQLKDANLMLSGSGLNLVLPYRIVNWPVPYRSI